MLYMHYELWEVKLEVNMNNLDSKKVESDVRTKRIFYYISLVGVIISWCAVFIVGSLNKSIESDFSVLVPFVFVILFSIGYSISKKTVKKDSKSFFLSFVVAILAYWVYTNFLR